MSQLERQLSDRQDLESEILKRLRREGCGNSESSFSDREIFKEADRRMFVKESETRK